MDSYAQAIEKLNFLYSMGHVTQEEYDLRRQTLVDGFIGVPMAPTTGAAAGFFAPQFTPRPSFGPGYGFGRGGGKGYGKGRNFSPYARSKVGSTSVKVQPLPPTVTEDDIKLAFARFGNVLSVAVKQGIPPHAYVNFGTAEEAAAAAFAGCIHIAGRSCHVGLSARPKPPVAEGEATNGIGIFNIPFNMTYEELLALLSAYPGLQSLKMVTRSTGDFRGYAFAYFDTVENAMHAKSMLLGMQLGGQVLDCKFSNKPAEQVLAGY